LKKSSLSAFFRVIIVVIKRLIFVVLAGLFRLGGVDFGVGPLGGSNTRGLSVRAEEFSELGHLLVI